MTTKFVTCFAAALAVSSGSFVWAQTAPAQQLNKDCVVSVLNRTVQVSERGTWVLPNVPSTQGQIRARATCVANGQTISGQSEYFSVINNGNVDVPNIQFGSLEQIPQTLSFGETTTSMAGAGSTRQLVLTAHYADGTSSDVTAASHGPNYSSSNVSIASVTANGRVTGVASGNVLISARKDGASAMILVTVVTSGDMDGDGLPAVTRPPVVVPKPVAYNVSGSSRFAG